MHTHTHNTHVEPLSTYIHAHHHAHTHPTMDTYIHTHHSLDRRQSSSSCAIDKVLLQHAATHCTTLQHTATHHSLFRTQSRSSCAIDKVPPPRSNKTFLHVTKGRGQNNWQCLTQGRARARTLSLSHTLTQSLAQSRTDTCA